jgi:hypothetical protein
MSNLKEISDSCSDYILGCNGTNPESGKPKCLSICASLLEELSRDVLSVKTEIITKNQEFSTKSTVTCLKSTT